MKRLRFVLFSMIIGLAPLYSQAGNSEKIDAEEQSGKMKKKRFYKKGKKLLKGLAYYRAVPYLKNASNVNPTSAEAAFHLARAYYETGQFTEALPSIEQAYGLDEFVDPEVELYMGRINHVNYNFEKAKIHYTNFLDNLDPEEEIYPIIEMYVKQCEAGPEVMDMNNGFKLDNLGPFVNSKYPEYAPQFAEEYNYMVFTSRRPRKVLKQMYGVYNPDYIREEIYESALHDSIYMETQLLSKKINIASHDATGVLSEDGNTLIFYRDDAFGDIFISEKEESGEWGKRVSIGDSINTEYNEPSVWITDEGQTLYYVSDKPGGLGKKDLYISKRLPDGTWGAGDNMGDKFNTIMDEDSPYIGPEGKYLYFSSRGHNSMGGYDVFRCEKEGDSWGKPENLGNPVNSTGEDIYFFFKDKGPGFYLSSDRIGGYGGLDIYYGYPHQEKDLDPTLVSGTIFDKINGENMAADVELLNRKTSEVLTQTKTDPVTGLYEVELPRCGIEYALNFVVSPKEVAREVPAESPPGRVNVITGNVFDGINGDPMNASVELIDPNTGKIIETVPTNPKTGNYYVPVKSGKDYTLRIKRDGYIPYYEEFSVEKTGDILGHIHEVDLQPSNEANKLVIGWQFFDFDKSNIRLNLEKDMDNLLSVLNKVPDLRLKIIGHTCTDGSAPYNQKLSERRANTVVNWLISKGIDRNRFQVFGMGEAQPMYDNSIPKLKPYNRRVEIYILDQ